MILTWKFQTWLSRVILTCELFTWFLRVFNVKITCITRDYHVVSSHVIITLTKTACVPDVTSYERLGWCFMKSRGRLHYRYTWSKLLVFNVMRVAHLFFSSFVCSLFCCLFWILNIHVCLVSWFCLVTRLLTLSNVIILEALSSPTIILDRCFVAAS